MIVFTTTKISQKVSKIAKKVPDDLLDFRYLVED
jgi:hypothetical protein